MIFKHVQGIHFCGRFIMEIRHVFVVIVFFSGLCFLSLTSGPLTQAVVLGNHHEVERLLKKGCNPDEIIQNGYTLLGHACANNMQNMVKLLLNYGADCNKYSCVKIPSHGSVYGTPLAFAVITGYLGPLKLLLKAKNIDVNKVNYNKRTALHLATSDRRTYLLSKRFSIIKELIKHGAKVNVKDSIGWTPIDNVISGIVLKYNYNPSVDACSLLEFLLKNSKHQCIENSFQLEKNTVSTFVTISMLVCREMTKSLSSENNDLLQVVKILFSYGVKITLNPITSKMMQKLVFNSYNFNQKSKKILEKLVLANQEDSHGITPLCKAVQANDLKKAKQCLANGTLVNRPNVDRNRFYPLHLAVLQNNAQIVSYLISQGAWLDSKDCHGFTPFHKAAEKGNVAMVKLLLKHKAPLDVRSKKHRWTVAHSAVLSGNSKVMEVLLLAKKELSSYVTTRGNTLLHLAVRRGKESIIDGLLKMGVNTLLKNKNGKTAYEVAQKYKKTKIAGLLRIYSPDESGNTILHAAARTGTIKDVKKYVEHYKLSPAPVNKRGITPLHVAVEKGHEKIVEYLFDHGVLADSKDKQGKTALHYAATPDVAKVLLRNGAALDALDDDDKTSLHYAAEQGNASLIHFFLSRGADYTLKDVYEQTPYECLVEHLTTKKSPTALLKSAMQRLQVLHFFDRSKIAIQCNKIRELCKKSDISCTFLMRAIASKNRQALWAALNQQTPKLLKSGCDPLMPHLSGVTPLSFVLHTSYAQARDMMLHYYALQENKEMVRY